MCSEVSIDTDVAKYRRRSFTCQNDSNRKLRSNQEDGTMRSERPRFCFRSVNGRAAPRAALEGASD